MNWFQKMLVNLILKICHSDKTLDELLETPPTPSFSFPVQPTRTIDEYAMEIVQRMICQLGEFQKFGFQIADSNLAVAMHNASNQLGYQMIQEHEDGEGFTDFILSFIPLN